MDARACGLLVQCMWFAFAQFSSFQFSEWAMGTAGGRIFAHKSYIFFNPGHKKRYWTTLTLILKPGAIN